jgi:hypothetical protein
VDFRVHEPLEGLPTNQFNESIDLGGEKFQSAGGIDAYLAALDGSGAVVDGCSYGSLGFQAFVGVDAAPDGILFVGDFADTVDFGNGPLSSAGGWDIVIGKLAPAPR